MASDHYFESVLEILRLTAENAPRKRPTKRRQNMSTNPITAATAEANGRTVSGPIYMVHFSAIWLSDDLNAARVRWIDRYAALHLGFKPTHRLIRIHDQRCTCPNQPASGRCSTNRQLLI